MRWSMEETTALIDGVFRRGVGMWRTILEVSLLACNLTGWAPK